MPGQRYPIQTARFTGTSPLNGGVSQPSAGFRLVFHSFTFTTTNGAGGDTLEVAFNPDAGVNTLLFNNITAANKEVEVSRNLVPAIALPKETALGLSVTAIGSPGNTIKGSMTFTIQPSSI